MNENRLVADQIEKVEVFVSQGCYQTVGRPFVIKTNPQVDAQFSIPYAVATAILKGKVGLDDFIEAKIREPRRSELAKKVTVFVDASLKEPSSNVVNLTARIVIHAGGKTYRYRSLVAKGHPELPMDRTEVINKFESCLQFGASHLYEKREKLVDSLLNLESVKDVRTLTEFLC
jgi:2-methylcitrate dehydratase PrpD